MKLLLPVLVIAVSFFAGSSAYGQYSGVQIESETVVYTASSAQNGTSFEAKISSNSSLVVHTVLIETNSSAAHSVIVAEWKVYGQSGDPFTYNSAEDLPSENGRVRTVAGIGTLPLGSPEGGGIGTRFEMSGLQEGDEVRITFVYMANTGSTVSSEIETGAALPFYITENSQALAGNGSRLEINDSFVNPELHCEICTAVQSLGPAEATYVANATDLADATTFSFWVMGADGGESVTFNVAGKEQDGAIIYANSTTLTLGSDWRMYEIDLADADLADITHLLNFETSGEQVFYVKGAAYS